MENKNYINKNYIKRMDAFGNTEGHPSNKAYSGDMVDERGPPEGCTPYSNPSQVPVYGSSTGVVKEVTEKKVKHNVTKKKGNFGSNYHR